MVFIIDERNAGKTVKILSNQNSYASSTQSGSYIEGCEGEGEGEGELIYFNLKEKA